MTPLSIYAMSSGVMIRPRPVRARHVSGTTVLRQANVTTFADQIAEHSSGLAAADVRGAFDRAK